MERGPRRTAGQVLQAGGAAVVPARYAPVVSPEATADVDEIGAYHFSHVSEEVADKIVGQIAAAIDSLENLPHRCKVYRGRKTAALSVHVLVTYPYLIYYRVDDTARTVRVLRVLHGARRQPKRFR